MADWIHSDIKLTIGMLVSNHIEYIRNCMESIQPLLAAVPSELVILDTKGEETDGSIAIVREYTDKIYPFTWCDDFAAARNALLSHANGEWFLFFDDDEWFDSVQEFIDFFKSGECERHYGGYYYTKDYDSIGGYTYGEASRMIRRTKKTHFVGKIHECFSEMPGPVKHFSCFTKHYGYAYRTPEERERHFERNIRLLREALKENENDMRMCVQMGIQLYSMERYQDEGYDFCLTCIDRFEKHCDQKGERLFQYLLFLSIQYFDLKEDYVSLKKRIEEIKERYEISETLRQVFAAFLMECAMKVGDEKEILIAVDEYLTMAEWRKHHEKEAILQTEGSFPNYLTKEIYERVVVKGILVANRQKEYERAYRYFQCFSWETEKNIPGWKRELEKTLQGLEDKGPLIKYYRAFYREELFTIENRGYLPKACREALQKWEN